MAYLWGMKIFFCILLTSICAFSWSQDKVYLLNGEVKKGVILEVPPNNITFMDHYRTPHSKERASCWWNLNRAKQKCLIRRRLIYLQLMAKGVIPDLKKHDVRWIR